MDGDQQDGQSSGEAGSHQEAGGTAGESSEVDTGRDKAKIELAHTIPPYGAAYEVRIDVLSTRVVDLEKDKNQAYRERNELVSTLAKICQGLGFPVALGKHQPASEDEAWDPEWLNVVFIQLPPGQVSWHVHDSDRELFKGLKQDEWVRWDGHTTQEKYERLRKWSDAIQRFQINF